MWKGHLFLAWCLLHKGKLLPCLCDHDLDTPSWLPEEFSGHRASLTSVPCAHNCIPRPSLLGDPSHGVSRGSVKLGSSSIVAQVVNLGV